MTPSSGKKTQTTLPALPLHEPHAIRLRGVLKRALQEAMAVGLGLGMGVGALACGGDSAEPPDMTGGVGGNVGGGGQGGVGGGQGGGGGGGAGGGGGNPMLTICEEARPFLGCDTREVRPDFARFRTQQEVTYWAVGQGETIRWGYGRSCATLPDPEACQRDINAAISRYVRPSASECQFEWCDPGEAFILAKGEMGIAIIKSSEALAQFLAPIDTVAEASAVGQHFESAVLKCVDERSGISCEGDAFTVVALRSSCGEDVWLKVKVPHSGAAPTTQELERTGNGCAIGRLPDGCQTEQPPHATWGTLADFWSECASLEAASVPAFRMLAEDLRGLGAPSTLVDEALSSANDEVVHAALVLALAAKAGAKSQQVLVPARAPKSLFDMAHENAVEGCVRETYGAFVAAYQAEMASDPESKRVLARIAEDEMKHAALSHAIAAWAEPQLSEQQRTLIANDRSQLIVELRRSTAAQHGPAVYGDAGYPTPDAALRMLDVLGSTVWS